MALVLLTTILTATLTTTAQAAPIRTQAAAEAVPGGIRGIDVSRWQGANINWGLVAQDNVHFVFARATYGTTIDQTFYANATGAHQAGIRVGAYHFATFTNRQTMLAEARAFVSQLERVSLTYPAVLDLEHARGISRANLTTLAIEFMEYVQSQGYSVMLYSYNNFFLERLDLSRLQGYDLWVANYVREPEIPGQTIWQYTDRGRVSGIAGNVDLNVAYVDMTVRRYVTVDKDISDNIKTFLNGRYDSGLVVDGPLDWPGVQDALYRALQHELNRILEEPIQINGRPTHAQINTLAGLQLRTDARGTITTLVQCKLFYRGYYTNEITGIFDEHTASAVARYQRSLRLDVTSTMTQATWHRLYPPIG
jgi:lysozyme